MRKYREADMSSFLLAMAHPGIVAWRKENVTLLGGNINSNFAKRSSISRYRIVI